jgi:hypothetical protein
MCFTRQQEPSFAKIAKEDIIAFKILTPSLCSPSRGTKWISGERKFESDLPRFLNAGEYSIHRGLHCCKTLEDARHYNLTTYSTRSYFIFKVRIPRGSLYWENSTQIVCDTMILITDQRVLRNGELSKKKN